MNEEIEKLIKINQELEEKIKIKNKEINEYKTREETIKKNKYYIFKKFLYIKIKYI